MPTTYVLNANAVANGIHVGGFEFGMDVTTGTSNTTVLVVNSASGTTAFIWVSPAGSPNSAAWPTNATYKAQFDCSSCGANITYGLLTIGSRNGHFARANSGLTADRETTQQAQAAFAGTGLKVASVVWSPSAGSADDRFELCMVAANSAAMTQNLQFSLGNSASSFAIWGDFTSAVPTRTLLGGGI